MQWVRVRRYFTEGKKWFFALSDIFLLNTYCVVLFSVPEGNSPFRQVDQNTQSLLKKKIIIKNQNKTKSRGKKAKQKTNETICKYAVINTVDQNWTSSYNTQEEEVNQKDARNVSHKPLPSFSSMLCLWKEPSCGTSPQHK